MTSEAPHIPDLERDLLATAARIYQAPGEERGRTRRRPALGRGRRLAPVGLALATATAAASVAFVVGAGSDPRADAVATQDAVEHSFGVFRQAVDAPPRQLAPFGLDAGSTHHVVSQAGPDVWIARRDDDQLCIISARANGFAAGCGDVERVIADGLFTDNSSSLPGTDTTADVAALLPDGVASVTLTLWNGARVDLPVSDNALAATLPARPRRARFLDAHGTVHAIDLGDNEEGRAQR